MTHKEYIMDWISKKGFIFELAHRKRGIASIECSRKSDTVYLLHDFLNVPDVHYSHLPVVGVHIAPLFSFTIKWYSKKKEKNDLKERYF